MMNEKMEFLLRALERGSITVEQAMKELSTEVEYPENATSTTPEDPSWEQICDKMVDEALFGAEPPYEGLKIDEILQYCKLSNWQMVDKKGNLRPVDRDMLIDNAKEVCYEALNDFRNKYKFSNKQDDVYIATGLFKAIVYVDCDQVCLELEFIGDTTFGYIDLNDVI